MDRRLYEEDFFLWTAEQAEALRTERARGLNVLDWDLLAEEIEDLGKRDRNAAFSLTRQILTHLYKLSAREEPKAHWRSEIVGFRADLENVLTASLRARVEAELERLHTLAAKQAALALAAQEPRAVIDPAVRWTLAQVLGESDDPA